MEQLLERLAPALATLPADQRQSIMSQAREGVRLAVEAATTIQQLPRPLPRPLGDLLARLGGWLSLPGKMLLFP